MTEAEKFLTWLTNAELPERQFSELPGRQNAGLPGRQNAGAGGKRLGKTLSARVEVI